MNISKFTQKSVQAVQDLEKVAYEYGNQEVEQEHLLYALLTQEDSLILKLIEKMEINKDYFINEEKQDGGTDMTCIGGNKLRAYLRGSSWAGVADVGAVTLNLYSMEHGDIPVASPDIQPKNGVVHALNYSYNFGKI